MLDVHLANESAVILSSEDISIAEAPGFVLTQLAGTDKDIRKSLGKLPTKVGVVVEHDGIAILRVGPRQFWAIGSPPAVGVAAMAACGRGFMQRRTGGATTPRTRCSQS